MKKPIIQIASRRVAEAIAALAREKGKAVGFLSIRSTDEDIPDLGWKIRNAYESDVFTDGKFSPNMRCYRMVLRAMGCDATPEELERLWQTAVDSADPV